MIYDSLAHHLPAAGSIDRAAVPLGMFVAFCANLGLVSASFAQRHETLLLRLRYREITGSELLTAGCGGELQRDMLSEAGQAFADRYLDRYMEDFRSVFGNDVYAVADSWQQYDRIAPVLMRELHGADPARKRRAGSTDSREKRWWQIWR